jgi:hypothetical protein
MKESSEGFRNNFRKFKASAKSVPCKVKLPLYWKLLRECMEKNDETREIVRNQWTDFNAPRIKMLIKKLGIK